MAGAGTGVATGDVARGALIGLVTAAVYVAAAKVGLSLAFAAEQVTTVWPPTGIAIAAIVRFGPRWTGPAIALGAFLANVTANEPVATAAGIAAGNTLEALTAAWCLRRVGFHPALARLRDALALVALAAGLSTTIAATIGVTSLCAGGVQPWSTFDTLWWTWWIGDALGALVVAPLLLVWTGPPVFRPAGRPIEASVLLVTTAAVGVLVFVLPRGPRIADYPLQYTVFPFVIWAALRFGQRGTTVVALLVSALSVWSAVGDGGGVPLSAPHDRLVRQQLFMAVVAVSGILLAAAIAERDDARQQGDRDLQRLLVSEKRLRLALDSGRMGVWDWDILSGAVQLSDNLESIHGLAPGTFTRTLEGFQALVHPDDRARVMQAIDQAVRDGTGYDATFRNVRDDGSVGWMTAKGRVVQDAAGRAVRMIGIGMDVTEAHRLAGELEARARALAQADRRKDEFLAMLAHELRNPLAPLTSALHLLRASGTERERALEVAERQATQLGRLVDDLLDASRITQGKIAIRPEPTTLDDVVARAVETARPAMEARGQIFELAVTTEPVGLHADPARLAQVIANLLDNAAKYTPPGGSIWLTAERSGDEVVLRVRDTGAGLAPDLVPNVFDLFVQDDRSLARSRGGLGIGLTIVRRVVELHGGRVEAQSDGVGRGSEFIVHLPATSVAGPPEHRAPAASARAPARSKLLLVEDHRDAGEVLGTILEIWGYDVRVVLDAAAALAAVDAWAPDVVLSDLGLPQMDGYELARCLRRHPSTREATLIALSGYGRDEDRRASLDAGFDHHLVKPPDLQILADLLAGAAARAEGRRSRAS
jgi:PAS domain S-box-containing protein